MNLFVARVIFFIKTLKRMPTPSLSFKKIDLATYDKRLKVSLPTSGSVLETETQWKRRYRGMTRPVYSGICGQFRIDKV